MVGWLVNEYGLLALGLLLGSLLGGQLATTLFSSAVSAGSGRDYGVLESLNSGGLLAGSFAAVFDLGKSLTLLICLPLLIDLESAGDWLPYSVAMAVILGHIFSPWAKFSGGKPVAVLLGCLAVLMPLSALLWLAVWLITAAVSRYASLASLLAAGSLPLYAVLAGSSLADRPMLGFALLALAMTIFCHRPNIRAMQVGSEPSLTADSFKRAKDGCES
jgi:glycerol-3-phosphate acyltransferase PlsY